MKQDITQTLVDEHRLILRMLDLLEGAAARTAAGSPDGLEFYLDAVDFIRNYADRFHHAKEEDILFAALVKNGMPRENSPVAAMLLEHDRGRGYVKAMEAAVKAALQGVSGQLPAIAGNAREYLEMLREHIAKEDSILYPLAERVIPEVMREEILDGYALAEARNAPTFARSYRELVERYEAEAADRAA